MLLGDQTRLHFAQENAARRRRLLADMAELDCWTVIYESRQPEPQCRSWAITRVVEALLSRGGQRLVIEGREPTLDRRERGEIAAAIGGRSDLVYEHMRAREEPLLWIPDAFAWAYGAGADWASRISATVVKDPG